jgi:hypothetical protein
VPDERPGLLVVHRSRDDEFSNGDRAIARLYARQLAERVAAAVAAMQPRSALWTRQLEAVQAISARLVRLATVAPRG